MTGSHKPLHHKKKKQPINCNESIVNDIYKLVHATYVKETLKKIKKLKYTKDEAQKAKHLPSINFLKAITKPQLKELSCHMLKERLTVDDEAMKRVAKKITGKEQIHLNQDIQKFADIIKQNAAFQKQIQKVTNKKSEIEQKKQAKKLLARMRRKAKLEKRKQLKQSKKSKKSEQQKESDELNMVAEQDDFFQKQSLQEREVAHPVEKKKFIQKTEPVRRERTQFKKTGRNKIIKEKRDKKHRKAEPIKSQQQQPVKKSSGPMSKFERLNAGQQLHPSWQAKRHIKDEMFIQPFSGKKTLL